MRLSSSFAAWFVVGITIVILALFFPNYSNLSRSYSTTLLPDVVNAKAVDVGWITCPNQKDQCQLIDIEIDNQKEKVLRYDVPENERAVKVGDTVQVVKDTTKSDPTYSWYGASADRMLILIGIVLLVVFMYTSWQKSLIFLGTLAFIFIYWIPAFLTHEGNTILIAAGACLLIYASSFTHSLTHKERLIFYIASIINITLTLTLTLLVIYFAQPNGALWIEHISYLDVSSHQLIGFSVVLISQYYISSIGLQSINHTFTREDIWEKISSFIYIAMGIAITTLFMITYYQHHISFDPVFVQLACMIAGVISAIIASSLVWKAIREALPPQDLPQTSLPEDHQAENAQSLKTEN